MSRGSRPPDPGVWASEFDGCLPHPSTSGDKPSDKVHTYRTVSSQTFVPQNPRHVEAFALTGNKYQGYNGLTDRAGLVEEHWKEGVGTSRWVRWVREQVYVLLALAAAAATTLFIFHYLAAAGQRVSVIVAAHDIAAGAQITEEMVRPAAVHASGVHPEAAAQAGAVVGRYSLVPVHQGEQILVPQLSGDEADRGFLTQLAPNERAMFVPLNLGRGLGGAVAAGDRVDVIFVPSEQKMGRSGAGTVLHGARVLDIRTDRGLPLEVKENKDPGFLGVLLAVTSQEAEQLAFYLEHGQLFLTLGGFRAKAGSLSGQMSFPLPPPPALAPGETTASGAALDVPATGPVGGTP